MFLVKDAIAFILSRLVGYIIVKNNDILKRGKSILHPQRVLARSLPYTIVAATITSISEWIVAVTIV